MHLLGGVAYLCASSFAKAAGTTPSQCVTTANHWCSSPGSGDFSTQPSPVDAHRPPPAKTISADTIASFGIGNVEEGMKLSPPIHLRTVCPANLTAPCPVRSELRSAHLRGRCPTMLLKTLPAQYRTSLRRPERYRGFLAALRTVRSRLHPARCPRFRERLRELTWVLGSRRRRKLSVEIAPLKPTNVILRQRSRPTTDDSQRRIYPFAGNRFRPI